MTGTVPPPPRASPLRLACPHCGLRAMSAPRKWALTAFGWEKPMPCRACGQQVEVRSFSVMRWTAPFIFFCLLASVLMAFGLIQPQLVMALAGALVIVALGGLLFGVPLHKRGRTDPQAVQRAHAARSARP